MTTPLAHEPLPGDGLVPYMSPLVHRLYHRLPEVYRTFDAIDSTWTFKRYLAGMLDQAGAIDDIIKFIAGERPVGPATPEPWALPPDELEFWRSNRLTRPSGLADPTQAPIEWLPWLAQLVGATLDPSASEQEQRDTITYATSGWRGGTRAAIADAAKSALTGSRYARIVPHTKPDGSGGLMAGTIWDLTIVTRTSETPDPGAVLGAVLRKGAKPAGVVLWHAAYESTWDQQQAVYPTWDLRDAATWDQIAEAGLLYVATPGNLFTNPSFEVDTTGWAPRGAISGIARITGGVDGLGMGRVTVSADGVGEVLFPIATVTPGDHNLSVSVMPDLARVGALVVDWLTAADALVSTVSTALGTLAADVWTRPDVIVTAPATTAKARVYIQLSGMLTGEHYDLDAAFLRRVP